MRCKTAYVLENGRVQLSLINPKFIMKDLNGLPKHPRKPYNSIGYIERVRYHDSGSLAKRNYSLGVKGGCWFEVIESYCKVFKIRNMY